MNKKREIYIIGTTDFSFMIGEFIELENQYNVVGYAVSASEIEKNIIRCQDRNVKLFCLEDILKQNKDNQLYLLNTIGYTKMNSTHERISCFCRENGAKMINFVSKNALNYGIIKGTNNLILPGAYIGTNVFLENDNIVYVGTVLTHDIQIGNNNFIAANCTVGGNVKVKNNCFIGMGTTIKNSVIIDSYTLVGAGCYVKNNTKAESVIVPNKSIELNKKSIEMKIGE